MAIGREPEPVEDRWLERTESKVVSAEARIDGDHSKAIYGGCCSTGCTVQASEVSRNIS